MEALKQITRILLDVDAADVLVLGLKIFVPVSAFYTVFVRNMSVQSKLLLTIFPHLFSSSLF